MRYCPACVEYRPEDVCRVHGTATLSGPPSAAAARASALLGDPEVAAPARSAAPLSWRPPPAPAAPAAAPMPVAAPRIARRPEPQALPSFANPAAGRGSFLPFLLVLFLIGGAAFAWWFSRQDQNAPASQHLAGLVQATGKLTASAAEAAHRALDDGPAPHSDPLPQQVLAIVARTTDPVRRCAGLRKVPIEVALRVSQTGAVMGAQLRKPAAQKATVACVRKALADVELRGAGVEPVLLVYPAP